MYRRRRLLEKLDWKFQPNQVAEVAAGYWWDPARATGSGATLTLPEMGGHSAYDMIVPGTGAAPVAGTVNSQQVLNFTNQTVTADPSLRTSAVKQRGWTGATVVWGWVSRAANLGTVVNHARTTPNIQVQFTTSDVRLVGYDNAGTAYEARFPLPTGGLAAGPVFYWGVLNPGQAHQMWYDGVQQTPNVSATQGAQLRDTAEFLNVGGAQSDTSASNYLADWSLGIFGFANGIPSAADHARLRSFRKLK